MRSYLFILFENIAWRQECGNKWQTFPALVNRVLEKLIKIIPFYNYVTIDSEWEDLSEQWDLAVWKILANKNDSKKK